MGYRAVIHACALYPFGVRDVLLTLAEQEFFDVLWSERILGEMSKNLIGDGRMTRQQTAATLEAMSATFEDAAVSRQQSTSWSR